MHKTRWRRPGLFSLILLLLALAWAWPTLAQTGDDQEKLELGARLFAENCAVCHGPEGQGRVGATLAKDFPSIRPDLAIETTIANGVAGSVMPAWGQANGGPLSEEEVGALVFYILSWQTGGPPVIAPTPTANPRPAMTAPPEVSGDPNQGALLYDLNCAVCHGTNGEGRVGATLAKDWPSIRPDLQVKATISRGVAGSPMPAWSQENGGPLVEADIDNLVAFILTLSEGPAAPAVTPTEAFPPPQAGRPSVWVLLGIVFIVLVVGGLYFMLNKRQ